ncbi:MAG: hypothetical protein NVS3B16_06930 [Vulcanimicrobiaceae bacterium]
MRREPRESFRVPCEHRHVDAQCEPARGGRERFQEPRSDEARTAGDEQPRPGERAKVAFAALEEIVEIALQNQEPPPSATRPAGIAAISTIDRAM